MCEMLVTTRNTFNLLSLLRIHGYVQPNKENICPWPIFDDSPYFQGPQCAVPVVSLAISNLSVKISHSYRFLCLMHGSEMYDTELRQGPNELLRVTLVEFPFVMTNVQTFGVISFLPALRNMFCHNHVDLSGLFSRFVLMRSSGYTNGTLIIPFWCIGGDVRQYCIFTPMHDNGINNVLYTSRQAYLLLQEGVPSYFRCDQFLEMKHALVDPCKVW